MSEYKKECVEALGEYFENMYDRFCKGNHCMECTLDIPNDDCVLFKVQDLLNTLEEKMK